MSRTEYHREYYWRNVERRRAQARKSKRRSRLSALLRAWRRW